LPLSEALMPNPYAILEAPSTLGLTIAGVEHLPGQLLALALALGLAERIHASHIRNLSVRKRPSSAGELGRVVTLQRKYPQI
jgi:arginase